jgi:hypothetical protein
MVTVPAKRITWGWAETTAGDTARRQATSTGRIVRIFPLQQTLGLPPMIALGKGGV